MTLAQSIVTLLGALAIVWVNYYFFFAARRSAEVAIPEESHGPQQSQS